MHMMLFLCLENTLSLLIKHDDATREECHYYLVVWQSALEGTCGEYRQRRQYSNIYVAKGKCSHHIPKQCSSFGSTECYLYIHEFQYAISDIAGFAAETLRIQNLEQRPQNTVCRRIAPVNTKTLQLDHIKSSLASHRRHPPYIASVVLSGSWPPHQKVHKQLNQLTRYRSASS